MAYIPASPGVPWSAYVRAQTAGSRSVSSSPEALDSDQARYASKRIFQHARSMTTGPRSLPTNSPSLISNQQTESIGQKVDLVIDIH